MNPIDLDKPPKLLEKREEKFQLYAAPINQLILENLSHLSKGLSFEEQK